MSKDISIESLFKEHSFEEIESVRDNIASEIEKRTELLKSIVKEKYRDIVETSDAIQSMKLNLKEVEQSLWSLDKSIAEFYTKVKEPQIDPSQTSKPIQAQEDITNDGSQSSKVTPRVDSNQAIKRLLDYSSTIWEHFDSGNLRDGVKLLNESIHLLDENRNNPSLNKAALNNLEITLNRAREMIKNNLWHKIQVAAPDQLGIIAGSDQEDLYHLSLVSSVEFLVEELRSSLSDTSYHAQIRRHQPYSYFNSQTNQIEHDTKVNDNFTTSYIQIPKYISPELDAFLYRICKIINTIAGFNLNRSAIVESLRVTINNALKVYTDIIPVVSLLKAETKRKRALQLYFDLLYLRILLNTSKNIDLIEKLDPLVTELASKYELMLDSIELYTFSAALHTNVMKLSQSTIRLYGLLIPHLQ